MSTTTLDKVMIFLAGIIVGIIVSVSLHGSNSASAQDGSMANPLNRIASSLESMSSSLSNIDRKMK